MFGQSVLDTDPQRRRALRRRFGMLFQQGALFSALSVFDNIAFPLRELHTLDEGMVADLVFLKLAMVELEARHARLMPAELSGGMVKRVALARALSLEPELLVLDEPTAGLDPDRSENFVKLLRMLQKELGFTVVMVTHDPETLAGLATRLAVLADQRIVACGTAAEVAAVDHPFVRNFFRFRSCAAAIRQGQELEHGEPRHMPWWRAVHPAAWSGRGASRSGGSAANTKRPTDYTVVTRHNVTGLNLQGQVRYRGIRVGKVEAIELDPADLCTTS
jgi:phospholipid/cholesterol/gamma-HCH transport system ATP-binding protein